MLNEICEPLGGLYSLTGYDWHLDINYCLTEPTCPTAFITPEGWNIARYRVDADTIEDSLKRVVALVVAEIIERKIVGGNGCYTNSHDGVFEKWLHERAAGSDAMMPDIPPTPGERP